MRIALLLASTMLTVSPTLFASQVLADAPKIGDGAEVISYGLPGFEKGLFITQDGYDGDELDGDPEASNFKFVKWEEIAKSFKKTLAITPKAYNPRKGG